MFAAASASFNCAAEISRAGLSSPGAASSFRPYCCIKPSVSRITYIWRYRCGSARALSGLGIARTLKQRGPDAEAPPYQNADKHLTVSRVVAVSRAAPFGTFVQASGWLAAGNTIMARKRKTSTDDL